MYKYLMISLFVSTCFSKFLIGVDFSSEGGENSQYEDLDIGFSLAYENNIGDKFGYGVEYLLPTEFEDYYVEVSMISLYGKYAFVKNENVIIYGKIGYSEPKYDIMNSFYNQLYPDLDYNYEIQHYVDSEGGFMYGLQFNFGPMNISFSNHISNTKIGFYFDGNNYQIDDTDFGINRIKASYSF